MTPQENYYRQLILKEVEWLIESCPEVNAHGVYLFIKNRISNDRTQ